MVVAVTWFCLDCRQVGTLNRAGRCSTCGSDAVAEGAVAKRQDLKGEDGFSRGANLRHEEAQWDLEMDVNDQEFCPVDGCDWTGRDLMEHFWAVAHELAEIRQRNLPQRIAQLQTHEVWLRRLGQGHGS